MEHTSQHDVLNTVSSKNPDSSFQQPEPSITTSPSSSKDRAERKLHMGTITSISVDGLIEIIETDPTNNGKRVVAKDLNYSTVLLFLTYQDKGGALVTYYTNKGEAVEPEGVAEIWADVMREAAAGLPITAAKSSQMQQNYPPAPGSLQYRDHGIKERVPALLAPSLSKLPNAKGQYDAIIEAQAAKAKSAKGE